MIIKLSPGEEIRIQAPGTIDVITISVHDLDNFPTVGDDGLEYATLFVDRESYDDSENLYDSRKSTNKYRKCSVNAGS